MPEDSLRKQNPFENIKEPLLAKVLSITYRSALLLGLITMLIGFGLYARSLVDQYISMSFAIASEAAIHIVDSYDVGPMMDDVLEIYHGMTEEELAAVGTEEYTAKYSEIENRPEYQQLKVTLEEIYGASGIEDVYIAYFDPETSALLYLCDPESTEWDNYEIGYWEPAEKRELKRFTEGSGEYRLHDISWTRKYEWMCTSGHPIYDYDGDPYLFVLADVTLNDIGYKLVGFILFYMLALILVLMVISMWLSRYMDIALVTPIKSIADAAQKYAEDRGSQDPSTGHFADLNITTGDEVEALGHVMADMETSLYEYEQSLAAITAERERVRTELSLATKIQADMLPNTFPAFPDREEFDIHASMEPAKDVGGDFYNFFAVDDDHICLMMADVSGKGIPASLFMMSSMIMLSDQVALGFSPAETLRRVNEAICANNREEMFVTVWLGILELSTGRVTAANAGHEFPVISDGNGRFELFRDPHGFVIGGMDGMKYKEYEFTMEHGSRLFLYTDGVTEATDVNDELYGTDRLLDALNAAGKSTAQETLHTVRSSIAEFVGEAEQFDDLTMMCVEFR